MNIMTMNMNKNEYDHMMNIMTINHTQKNLKIFLSHFDELSVAKLWS